MPEIKNYDGKKKKHSGHAKRRPHHEMPDEINTEAQNEGVESPADMRADARAAFEEMPETPPQVDEETAQPSEDEGVHEPHHEEQPQKVHVEFYGSDIIREKAPKVMELADTVADEWVKDGQFEGLPVGNPIAQMAAAKALRTAKDVEKKLEEKGVFAMAKMGLDYVKAKIEEKKRH
ncbi:hypothetical protein [Bdellovibrio sp. HCB2-146]|uniref:hypothetical protein n=1 Tax=Bdellovibrio sp. HCB2-146 TaxID=3394362 RepID=UPI0039BC636E